jgi:hypothetical protein
MAGPGRPEKAPTRRSSGSPSFLLLASVALISGSALGLEILLMRLFSIAWWHHFAYMVISLALLGYGASGTFLTLGPNLDPRPAPGPVPGRLHRRGGALRPRRAGRLP